MSSNWAENYLSDLSDEITVGYVGSMTHEYADSGIPFLRSKNISNYEIVWDDIKYISSTFHNKIKKSVLRPGDVAVVRTGKPGTSCVIPNELSEGNCSDLVIIRVDEKKLCPHYLCYYLNSIAVHQINAQIVGAVQQHFNVGSAKNLKIKTPSLFIQKRISFFLQCLDNKIKLNKLTNQTLEQMAQALFKSWFADFEPVKAKIAVLEAGGSRVDATLAAMTAISGKNTDALVIFEREHPEQYAELKATADLFPSAMQDSELGEIPAGWRTDIVDSIVDRLKVKNTFPADCVKQFGKHPVLEQGAKVYQGYHDEEPSFNASLQSPMFIFGDHTCVIHLSIVPFDISKNTLVLKGKGFNTYWTFFAIKGKQKFQEYKRHWSDLRIKQVIIPDEANGLLLTNLFANKCENLFGLLEQNRKQNMTLQNIRDNLLPKLLSGEITLPEAEQAVSEVENV